MPKLTGGLPPRYTELLRLTLAAALLRLVPLAPAVLAYFLLPRASWLRLLLLLCPVLWVFVVGPARVRYGKILAAFTADASAPLRARALLQKETEWRIMCRGRVRRMGRQALPFYVLFAFLIVLYLLFDAFSILHVLLTVFGGIATALATMATFLPRLLLGKPMVLDAGAIGGIAALTVALAVCLLLFGLVVFRTSPYRFGVPDKQKIRVMMPLLKRNLRLWLPTLALAVVLLLFAYPQLSLLLANFLGAAPLFAVKLRLHQSILLALTVVSYFLLLPARRYNTAVWTKTHGGDVKE